MAEKAEASVEDSGFFLTNILLEIVRSPLNVGLVGLILILIYKIWRSRTARPIVHVPEEPALPKLRRDFTYEELKEFDGIKNADGRILVGVNGKVFDVTRGKRFYGPGGPYAFFAGKDASRGLATFNVEACKDQWDDLSDLNTNEMDSIREWEMQFQEKYDYVGRFLRPNEKHRDYDLVEETEEKTAQPASTSEPPPQETESKKDA